MAFLIGVDVGTTHTKAVLFSTRPGRVVRRARLPTPSYQPRPGWVEIDPEQLWATIRDCIRAVLVGRGAGTIAALGVASMAEAGVPIDRQGEWLYPIISWQDGRTETQVAWLRERFGDAALHALVGFVPERKYTATRLLWLRTHEPERFRQLARWLSVADLALWKLTGQAATDFTLASRTLLLEQRTRTWAAPLLDALDLSPGQLPQLHASGTIIGVVNVHAAEETGLAPGTPVATGGHDHLCAALACGLVAPGQILTSCGTAAAVFALTPSFVSGVPEEYRPASPATPGSMAATTPWAQACLPGAISSAG